MSDTKFKPMIAFDSGNPVFDALVTIVASGHCSVRLEELHAALLMLSAKEPGGFKQAIKTNRVGAI